MATSIHREPDVCRHRVPAWSWPRMEEGGVPSQNVAGSWCHHWQAQVLLPCPREGEIRTQHPKQGAVTKALCLLWLITSFKKNFNDRIE